MDWQAFLTDNDDFKKWSPEHWSWLGFGAISTVFWLFLGKMQPTDDRKKRVGLAMSLIPVGVWFWFLGTILWVGKWENRNVLPFHLCYFLNFVMPVMLWRRAFWLFEITFYWVLSACFQALLTPDLTTAAPAYFSLKYWFVHIGLVQSALFGAVVYGFRPRLVGAFWALLAGNLYLGFAHGVNLLLGTNFMYSIQKPPATVLDLLGDHYLLKAQFLALGFFLVIWLPFGLAQRRKKMIERAFYD